MEKSTKGLSAEAAVLQRERSKNNTAYTVKRFSEAVNAICTTQLIGDDDKATLKHMAKSAAMNYMGITI